MQEIKIKYRNWACGSPPKRIKLEIPGWGGEKHWDSGQPWHCKPFNDGATYGLELIYPFHTEVRVSNNNGWPEFKCDSYDEWKNLDIPFPFKSFAKNHFGFTSSTDIKTQPGYGILILPHSRFFTDMTGTVPMPSIGMIESDWWPRIFFIAFKSPIKDCEYVFRHGEGIAQVIVVPKHIQYNIEKMSVEEERSRAKQEEVLSKHGNKIATKSWKDKFNFDFDNKYKVLSQMDQRKPQSPTMYLENMQEYEAERKEAEQNIRDSRLSRMYIKPENYNDHRTRWKDNKGNKTE